MEPFHLKRTSSPRPRAGLAFVLAGLAACGRPDQSEQAATGGPPAKLEVHIRTEAPEAFVHVRALDPSGQPVAAPRVTWTVTGGFFRTHERVQSKRLPITGDVADWFGFTATDSVRVSVSGVPDVVLPAPAALALPPLVPAPAPPLTTPGSVTPSALLPVVGPLVLRRANQAEPLTTFDANFARTERIRYAEYARAASPEAAVVANHYGALRSRLMWALRNALPYGRNLPTDTSVYDRGRHIVLDYLTGFASAKGHRVQAHENTGLADAEILWILERRPEAKAHLRVSAQVATSDADGTLRFRQPWSDARQLAVALQALHAAHRLGFPFTRSDVNPMAPFDSTPGSWRAAGQRLIRWIDELAIVHADGSLLSPAHDFQEAYLFNAMLATELLRWYGWVDADNRVIALARRLMDHMIQARPRDWPTLPYRSGDPFPAHDLAAFYVWPALVLWQETGDGAYRDFALDNLRAAHAAFIVATKEWNQTYSTLAQGAEALLLGLPWRPGLVPR